jgi:hypothetical protein
LRSKSKTINNTSATCTVADRTAAGDAGNARASGENDFRRLRPQRPRRATSALPPRRPRLFRDRSIVDGGRGRNEKSDMKTIFYDEYEIAKKKKKYVSIERRAVISYNRLIN